MTDSCAEYDRRAAELASRYETLAFEAVHESILDLLPPAGSRILDVGAGSGRDAAWLARHGYEVTAVEPSAGMRKEASALGRDGSIRWIDDVLPALSVTHRTGLSFDFILLSGVWMHIRPDERQRAFRKLVTLLRPGGQIAISLRIGSPDPERQMYPVSIEELERLGREFGTPVVHTGESADLLGRSAVQWKTVVLRLPDDGAGALPLLRHVVLRDDKSSTYKIALLRVLARIADSATGLARFEDEHVAIPLGVVALYWIRMMKPLVEGDLPQSPTHRGYTGLGFVRDGFRRLQPFASQDLRIGSRWSGDGLKALAAALADAAKTIAEQPANFTTYPGSDQRIFPVRRQRRTATPDPLTIDAPFLWSFGELCVPDHLWHALARYNVWVEPVLVAEWSRLVEGYARNQGRSISAAVVSEKLRWLDPERDTAYVRSITAEILERGEPIHCVWTGKRLKSGQLDVDHCFPFSAWPCNDLWNLMPASAAVNRHGKSNRLVSMQTLVAARARIEDWWSRAYLQRHAGLDEQRFFYEASASLPIAGSVPSTEEVFAGVELRRNALRIDQGIAEWEGA